MEGAVRSGYLAAEAILSDAGAPQKFLRPGLPAEGLARLWARESRRFRTFLFRRAFMTKPKRGKWKIDAPRLA
jgi:hypothetical protein